MSFNVTDDVPRVTLATLGVVRIAGLALLVSLTSCSWGSHVVEERYVYWNETIARELPIGTSLVEIYRWGEANHVEFSRPVNNARGHWVSAVVDRKPVTFGFPCAEWMVNIRISLDATDRSTENKVSKVGVCL